MEQLRFKISGSFGVEEGVILFLYFEVFELG